jgi:hypothetical protein
MLAKLNAAMVTRTMIFMVSLLDEKGPAFQPTPWRYVVAAGRTG